MDEDDEKHSGSAAVTRKALTSFPFSKTTCVCNCGKYNLRDLPRLRKILPEDYEYKLCEYLLLDREDKFLVTLRMTLSTREEALEWKRRFEEKSLTTHVKDKTFPKVERVSIFKAQYRCQFFDRRRNKKKLPEKSKFRDCRSILFMNIKKYFKNTVDRHMPKYQTVIRLHYAHDHPLDTADVLKKRQLNEDIKCRFLEMFQQGMKPKDALDKHKRELLQNLGAERYRQVVCDGYYVPNVPKAYRLYYQIHGKGVSAKTTTKRSSRHNPNPDWIAFQNFPDAVAADNDEGCNVDDGGGGSDSDVLDNGCDDTVEEKNKGEMKQQNLDITCQRIGNNQRTLTSEESVAGSVNAHNLPATHSLDSKPIVDSGTNHCMMSHDIQLQKLASTNTSYSNISSHNSTYTDVRGQNLSAHTMPVSSFSDTHINMGGLFNLAQPTWENFNMTHQQASAPSIQQQQTMGFQNLEHQHSAANYMILPNSSCQNPHFVTSHEMIDHNIGLQHSVPRTLPADLNIAGSNFNQQYSWTQLPSNYNLSTSQVNPHLQDMRRDQTLTSKHSTNQSQTVKKLSVKKAAKKKKKPTRELNMKHVTKRWMDKKPKVEAETQNLASEVLHTIILTDEAEKLKVKLLTFLSGLESKMTLNPKLFVPVIRQFLHAGESAEDDNKLASYLRDFGKTEENVIKNLEARKIESRETHSTQTKLSGPVFKLANVKSLRGNDKSNRGNDKSNRGNDKLNRGNVKSRVCISATVMNRKSCLVAEVNKSTLDCNIQIKHKSNVNIDHPTLTEDNFNSNKFDVTLCTCELKSGCDSNGKHVSDCTKNSNHADIIHSIGCKQLQKPSTRKLRNVKDRNTISSHKQKMRGKHKTPGDLTLAGKELCGADILSELHQVSSDVSPACDNHTKKIMVKFTRIKQSTELCQDN